MAPGTQAGTMLTESTRQNKKKNRDAHIWTQNRIRTGRADAGRAFVANCPVPADQVPTASLSCPLTVALAGLLELDSARFSDGISLKANVNVNRNLQFTLRVLMKPNVNRNRNRSARRRRRFFWSLFGLFFDIWVLAQI